MNRMNWMLNHWMELGTTALAVTTGLLVVATLWLCFEARATRLANEKWRELDDVIAGIAPFVGKYVEKGKLNKADPNNPAFHGAKVEVNRWGAFMVVPPIGYFCRWPS